MWAALASRFLPEQKDGSETGSDGSTSESSLPQDTSAHSAPVKPQRKTVAYSAGNVEQLSTGRPQSPTGTLSRSHHKGRPRRPPTANKRPWMQPEYRANRLKRGGVPTIGSPPASRHSGRNQHGTAGGISPEELEETGDVDQSSTKWESSLTAMSHTTTVQSWIGNGRKGGHAAGDQKGSASVSPEGSAGSTEDSPSATVNTAAASVGGQKPGAVTAASSAPGGQTNLAGITSAIAKASFSNEPAAATSASPKKAVSTGAEQLAAQPPAASAVGEEGGGAGDVDLGPMPGEEEYQGQYVDDGVSCWLRVWVLCSVTVTVLMIPLAFTILSYRAVGRVRTNPPRRTLAPPLSPQTVPGNIIDIDNLVLYDDKAGRPDNCTSSPDYTNLPSLPTFHVAPSSNETKVLNMRRVFCVLDTLNLTSSFAHSVPYNYCTDIIVYSMYYDKASGLRMKRRAGGSSGPGLPYLNVVPLHRGMKTNLYFTYGGSRADSAAIAKSMSASSHIDLVQAIRTVLTLHGYTGFNLDWDRPNDNCGTSMTVDYLRFLGRFRHVDHVLITVPPDAEILKRDYGLLGVTLPAVKFVIVATHRLRPSGLVYCTGARIHAAAVFSDVHKMLGPKFKGRLAYSVALGVDLYLSKEKKFGAPGVAVTRFYNPAQGKLKLSYDAVCKAPAIAATSECVLAATGRGNAAGYELATFAGLAQVTERFHASFDDGMGSLPVVVYDIELDDHTDACKFAGKSPLLAAIAGVGSI